MTGPLGYFFCLRVEYSNSNLKEHMSKTIQCSYWINISVFSHVAGLPTLKAKWLDTITVKRWEILINNDVSLSSATNEETPYEQLHYYLASRGPSIFLFPTYLGRSKGLCSQGTTLPIFNWNIDVYISVISVNNDAIYVCIKPHVRLKMSHIFSIINFVELLFEKFPLCIASETFEYSQARKLSFSDEIKKKSLGFLHNQSLTVCRNPYSILFRFFCFRLICKTIAELDKTQTRKHVKVI